MVARMTGLARTLPYRTWLPLVGGALLGLALRLAFAGVPGGPYAAMMASFVLLAPWAVGAATVYIAERFERRTWSYYFTVGAIANVLFVTGTLAILIEGIICAILIVPLFAVVGGIAGLPMGAICRATNWPKRALSSFAVLPLLLGAFEHRVGLPDRALVIERTVRIDAQPARIRPHLVSTPDIHPNEIGDAWMYRIGVPLPTAGVAESVDGRMVRHVEMGKGIHFDQVADVWEPEQRVLWR